MRYLLIYPLILIFVLSACTPYKKTVLEEDFVGDSVQGNDVDVEKEISSLRNEMMGSFNDPLLFRRLAILYRLQGTPYSRAKSIEAIDKAISLDPDDPMNMIEKGLTLYAMQFSGDAQKAFREALKIEPGCFHAWYHLGRIKKYEYLENMCFTEELISALRYYKKAFNINNRDKDTVFNLGFLHLLRRMFRTSKKYSSQLTELYPEEPRSRLLAGTVYLRLGDFPRAEKEFKLALDLMDDDEKYYYLDTSPLLPPDQQEEYFVWPDEGKINWNKRFWLMNDPTMATEINERLLAHYERVFFARELLTLKRLDIEGAETARGKALISYGLPDKLLYDLGQGTDGPMVVWEYSSSTTSFRLYFQDEFLNGNYHIPIDPAYRAVAEMTQNIVNNYPQIYQYPVDSYDAPFHIATSERRSSDEKTNIEFAIALPDSVIDKSKNKYSFYLTAFDKDLNRIISETFPIRPDTLEQFRKNDTNYYLYNFSTELAARIGESTFGVEFFGGKPLRRGTWKDIFQIRSFASGPLKTSSIRFVMIGSDSTCTDRLDPIPVYSTGSTLCLSYDIYNLKRDAENLSRYRVTYSIKSPVKRESDYKGFRNTLYWIKRSIRGTADQGSPFITSSLEQSVNASEVIDMIQIDISALEPGKYVLVLKVEDLNSAGITIEENTFVIRD